MNKLSICTTSPISAERENMNITTFGFNSMPNRKYDFSKLHYKNFFEESEEYFWRKASWIGLARIQQFLTFEKLVEVTFKSTFSTEIINYQEPFVSFLVLNVTKWRNLWKMKCERDFYFWILTLSVTRLKDFPFLELF